MLKKALSGRGASRSTIVHVHVAAECGRFLALVAATSNFDVGLLHVRVFFKEFEGSILNIKMPLATDLLHPNAEMERESHKLKRLVQQPDSFFMDVKCPGCYKIATVFSHAQTVVVCTGCSTVLCQPTGGKAKLVEGCAFRRKAT